MLIIVSCLVVIGLCGYGYMSVFGPDEFVWRDEIREGQELVVKVETFRQENHRLPESLEEVGIRDPDSLRLNYEKCNDSEYLLSFGTTLGESMTYNPIKRKWEPDNDPCPK
jgi:hypothetical protein